MRSPLLRHLIIVGVGLAASQCLATAEGLPVGELKRETKVDFAKVAEGFGCHGQTIKTLEALPAAFEQAMQAGKPAVIDIEVEYTVHPMDFMWPSVILHGFQFPESKRIQAAA